jgi:general secretion pathway protein G
VGSTPASRTTCMKTILPWILVVAFAACTGGIYFSGTSKETELAKARDQIQQMDTLQTQAEALQKQAAAQNDEITSLRKDNEELLRLRNEVRQLRDEKQQLNKQLQTSQAQAERSQAMAQQVQAQANQTATQIAEQRIVQMRQDQQNVATCINNLRLIDGAKQTWALERNKTPDAVPTLQDILPYLPNQFFPQCPGGGNYSINAVSNRPTCSIAGHLLQ